MEGGTCYLGNKSESPWGKDVSTDLWTSDSVSVKTAWLKKQNIQDPLALIIAVYAVSYLNCYYHLSFKVS